jgi:hypothetical protein
MLLRVPISSEIRVHTLNPKLVEHCIIDDGPLRLLDERVQTGVPAPAPDELRNAHPRDEMGLIPTESPAVFLFQAQPEQQLRPESFCGDTDHPVDSDSRSVSRPKVTWVGALPDPKVSATADVWKQ